MFGLFKKRVGRVSLEQRLHILAECGIAMRPDRSISELLISISREELEAGPYLHLITLLGSEVEEEPFERCFSDNVWHLDTECIEDPGSYVRIAERMRALAQGNLPIERVEDSVDLGDGESEGSAWLSFELDGQRVTWEATVNSDWLDTSILERFDDILAARGSVRRFTYFDLGGQDCLIGCATPSELERLPQRTGFGFQWLKGPAT